MIFHALSFCAASRALPLAIFLTLAAGVLPRTSRAAELDYDVVDKRLKVVLLDSDDKQSFLAVRADCTGRLFVGGREALFVYEPDAKGKEGYAPRQQIFKFPDHTWVYDIAILGDDVYVMTVSALYVLPDARVSREGITAKRLIYGVPMGHVHQCFHSLAFGPEGDLYFTMGDPLWYYGDFTRPDHWGHWTFLSQPEEGKTGEVKSPYNGVGGVFKCRPDGSKFQVVARGLRNSCGLCFDHDWNLFTNDNDHEAMPADYVPGKLNHVTPHSYFSWPRGWLLAKTPQRTDMLESMTAGLGRFVPVGQAYYDDLYLPAEYRHNLLVARWCTREVTRYPLERNGATFKVKEEKVLVGKNTARPVGVCVGRGGRIFVTISYMAHNEGSPVYRSDLAMITRKEDTADHPFDGIEVARAGGPQLIKELESDLWSRRHDAHCELMRRGREFIRKTKLDSVRRWSHHAWLAAATGPSKENAHWVEMMWDSSDGGDGSEEDFVQVLRAFPGAHVETLAKILKSSEPRLVHAAVLQLFDPATGELPKELISGPARSDDTYIRQAAVLLLAERGTIPQLRELCKSEDPRTRLAVALACGFRLTLPPATGELAPHLPLDKLREDSAYTVELIDGKVDLRKHGPVGNFTTADHWKAGKHTDEQEELFSLLSKKLTDTDEKVRLTAAQFLFVLNDPRSEPSVAKVFAANEDKLLGIARPITLQEAWIAEPFPDGKLGLDSVHAPEKGPIDLAASYEIDGKKLAWTKAKHERTFVFTKLLAPAERASYYVYFRLESGKKQRAELALGSDDGVKVWQNGRQIWENDTVRSPLPFSDVVKMVLDQGSNDFLIKVNNVTGDSAILTHVRALSEVAVRLPEPITGASLAERLKEASAAGGQFKLDPAFLTVDWQASLKRGDPEKGRKLFSADGLGCAKCHAITADAAGGNGPSLAGAAKRFTVPYLVESVLMPSKTISPVFKSTAILTKDGRSFTGLVISETAEKLELIAPDTKKTVLEKKDIETRELQNLSVMPQGVVKTPDELRDILTYLLSENPPAP